MKGKGKEEGKRCSNSQQAYGNDVVGGFMGAGTGARKSACVGVGENAVCKKERGRDGSRAHPDRPIQTRRGEAPAPLTTKQRRESAASGKEEWGVEGKRGSAAEDL